MDRENPYRAGQLRGRVDGTLTGAEADALVDAMSVKFTGDPFPMRDNTVYLIAPDYSRFAGLALPFAGHAGEDGVNRERQPDLPDRPVPSPAWLERLFKGECSGRGAVPAQMVQAGDRLLD